MYTLPFKSFLKEPEQNGTFEVIQQGNNPIVGFANGNPCEDYKDTVIFGDHTLSLYKPERPFFVATDGVRLIKGKDINGYYLLSLLEKYKPQNEGYKRYYKILSEQMCYISKNYAEQQKIGSLFQHVDYLIALQEQKITLLNKYKEGLLSYIFNDFSCVKSYNFKEIFVKYNEKNKSNYPQYTIGVNGIKLLESDRNNYDISNHKLFSPDSLILGIGINEVGISDCFGCCSPIYLTYKINTEIVNPVFAKYYIPIVFKKNKSLITRKSTRRDFELTKDVEDLLITIPLINEQDEIAKILSTFDELIEKENNILSLLKKYKQGLLQQMFI